MLNPKAISVFQLMELVPDEPSAIAFFEARRWPKQTYCPRCGSLDAARTKNGKPMSHWCKDCRRHFSVRTGTVMAGTNLPLRKWLLAMYYMLTARKGVSSLHMARLIGVTQKTAWFLGHRIREAMKYKGGLMFGEVEVDETYVGGREPRKHSKNKLRDLQAFGKMPVMGFRERHSGRVHAFPLGWDSEQRTYHRHVRENVQPGSSLYSDEHRSYHGLHRVYRHLSVSHSKGEYVWMDAHTNGIESFWAQVKRAYKGTFHWMSYHHIHRYINELAYRQSLGNPDGLAAIIHLMKRLDGVRLTYKALAASPDPLPESIRSAITRRRR